MDYAQQVNSQLEHVKALHRRGFWTVPSRDEEDPQPSCHYLDDIVGIQCDPGYRTAISLERFGDNDRLVAVDFEFPFKQRPYTPPIVRRVDGIVEIEMGKPIGELHRESPEAIAAWVARHTAFCGVDLPTTCIWQTAAGKYRLLYRVGMDTPLPERDMSISRYLKIRSKYAFWFIWPGTGDDRLQGDVAPAPQWLAERLDAEILA